jgi:hypothetical protein
VSTKTDSSICIRQFDSIDIKDSFFDTLKASYVEFEDWFSRKCKQGESAYVVYSDSGELNAFLYLKIEKGPLVDINPILNVEKCLKVGTFKIDAHGTRLGVDQHPNGATDRHPNRASKSERFSLGRPRLVTCL